MYDPSELEATTSLAQGCAAFTLRQVTGTLPSQQTTNSESILRRNRLQRRELLSKRQASAPQLPVNCRSTNFLLLQHSPIFRLSQP